MTATTEPRSRRLYDIASDFQSFEELLLEAGGEWTPEAAELEAELNASIEQKAYGYCAIIAEREARAAQWTKEAERCMAHAKAENNTARRLKERLSDAFGMMQITKLDVGAFVVSRQANPRSVDVLVPAEALPAFYRREIPATIEPDKKAIAAILREHPEVELVDEDGTPLARFAEPTFSVRIR